MNWCRAVSRNEALGLLWPQSGSLESLRKPFTLILTQYVIRRDRERLTGRDNLILKWVLMNWGGYGFRSVNDLNHMYVRGWHIGTDPTPWTLLPVLWIWRNGFQGNEWLLYKYVGWVGSRLYLSGVSCRISLFSSITWMTFLNTDGGNDSKAFVVYDVRPEKNFGARPIKCTVRLQFRHGREVLINEEFRFREL